MMRAISTVYIAQFDYERHNLTTIAGYWVDERNKIEWKDNKHVLKRTRIVTSFHVPTNIAW